MNIILIIKKINKIISKIIKLALNISCNFINLTSTNSYKLLPMYEKKKMRGVNPIVDEIKNFLILIYKLYLHEIQF